jgi:hypothetical protein
MHSAAVLKGDVGVNSNSISWAEKTRGELEAKKGGCRKDKEPGEKEEKTRRFST